jgi:hypothetical protein
LQELIVALLVALLVLLVDQRRRLDRIEESLNVDEDHTGIGFQYETDETYEL